MASKPAGAKQGDMLFACTNCHKKYKFEQLSSGQQLCKSCRQKHPLISCTYCRLEFHPVKRSSTVTDGRLSCEHCTRQFKQYGPPSACTVCNLQSAFNGDKCSRCAHSEKKYGPPVTCDSCKHVCAFMKDEEARQKVDGKTLCLLCTISYKKTIHRKRSSSRDHSATLSEEKPRASKKPRVDLVLHEPAQRSFSSNSNSQFEGVTSNHLVEVERLQTEIGSLKKQLVTKEQVLIEKDKMICALKAEGLEKDKKYLNMQKMHTDAADFLKEEIKNLKRQVSVSAKGSSKKEKDRDLPTSLSSTLPTSSVA